MMTTRDELLALARKRITVTVRSVTVHLQELRGGEFESYQAACRTVGPDGKIESVILEGARSKLLVRVIVDEGGKRLFSDDEVELLEQMPTTVLDVLFDAWQTEFGEEMSDKAVEVEAKN